MKKETTFTLNVIASTSKYENSGSLCNSTWQSSPFGGTSRHSRQIKFYLSDNQNDNDNKNIILNKLGNKGFI